MGIQEIDYRKFSNRVCNLREAGFIGLGFAVAVGIIAVILVSIFLATGCSEGEKACRSGKCIKADLFCNGEQDCPINDDEWQCPPTQFYVSFRVDHATMSFDKEKLGTNTSAEFGPTKSIFEQAIFETMKAKHNDELAKVEVFRFRGVNSTGQNDTETPGHNVVLAVDSFITFKGLKILRPETAEGNLRPADITNTITKETKPLLKHYDPVIDARQLQAVHTGVAVVLNAPDETKVKEEERAQPCRVKQVFCQNYCEPPLYYQYGTTKGCPECICQKA